MAGFFLVCTCKREVRGRVHGKKPRIHIGTRFGAKNGANIIIAVAVNYSWLSVQRFNFKPAIPSFSLLPRPRSCSSLRHQLKGKKHQTACPRPPHPPIFFFLSSSTRRSNFPRFQALMRADFTRFTVCLHKRL